jgi:hypothetical protein
MQWVMAANDEETGTTKYVVAEMDQMMVRVSLRATFMITPNLSVQYWGQPFGMIGKYKNFKIITDPRAEDYSDRFLALTGPRMTMENNMYSVDANVNGTPDFGFSNPDFNFAQFRSNMVIRWEYIPGSTVFLVWTRERNGGFYEDSDQKRYYHFDFQERGHNIFLIKYTYRFVL